MYAFSPPSLICLVTVLIVLFYKCKLICKQMTMYVCGVIQLWLTFWGARFDWPLAFWGPIWTHMHKHTSTLTTGQKTTKKTLLLRSVNREARCVPVVNPQYHWSVLCSPFASTNSFHFPLSVQQCFLISFSSLFPVGQLQRRLKTSSCTSHIPLQVPANKKKACMNPWSL